MSVQMPVFPLGTVLYPGLVLPLHIFEERYRMLVRDLVARPDDEGRRFGVVAIREGREVGADGVRALHEVGCTAELRQVEAYEDGRFDVVTVGTTRFRLLAIDTSLPYLQGEVELLPELPGDSSSVLAASVGTVFGVYRGALRSAQASVAASYQPDDGETDIGDLGDAGDTGDTDDADADADAEDLAAFAELDDIDDLDDLEVPGDLGSAGGGYDAGARPRRSGSGLDLPEDVGVLSYLVAAAMILDLPDKQQLLAAPDVTARLRAELALLRRETTMLRLLPSLPAVDLLRQPVHPN